MQIRIFLALGVLCLAAASPAKADIYKCLAADGRVTYSNVADKNCKRMNLEPLPTIPAPAKAATRTPTPTAFPKVEEGAQKARDNDRRRILESELSAEQKNLEQAKKELAAQEEVRYGDERNYQKMLDRLQPFKDKVSLHERNVESIESELARLR